jgi:ABC-2 type transport system permease protein
MTGEIYDIGYRRYAGDRLGRPGALRAIFNGGFRALFGFGRSFRSKWWPFAALGIALFPALIALALPAVLGQAGAGDAAEFLELFSYDTYLYQNGWILPLFLATQAPELLVTDRRYNVLPLYFSRPITPFDYLSARWASLAVGLLGLTLLPLLVLWTGTILLDEDVVAAFGDEASAVPGIVAVSVIYVVILAAIALAVSAYAGRKAYAAGAVIAVFLLGGALAGILHAERGIAAWAVLLDPMSVIDGTRMWLFDGAPAPESPAASTSLPGWVFGVAALGYLAPAAAALAWRYRGAAKA